MPGGSATDRPGPAQQAAPPEPNPVHASDDHGDGAATPRRRQLALALAVASLVGMLTIGTVRLLRDGSLWLDEASIAANLLSLGLFEIFGPYPTGHSFPRLYLFLIGALERSVGYETMVLRALPFAAFVAGACAWQRLTWLRFRTRPLLLALIITLNFIPASWFAYGAMLKQYSLDVALGLIPFLLGDAFYARVLAGEVAPGDRRQTDPPRRAVGLLLLVPLLFSFTYVIPLLGRVLGWALARWLRDRRIAPTRSLVAATGATALGVLALWLLDMRHTAGRDGLFRFWQKCIPGDDWSRTPEIVWEFATGWYRVSPFGARESLAEPLIVVLALCLPLGAYAVLQRAAASADAAPGADAAERAWGSRSIGCLAVIGGLLAASCMVSYPLCSGRLTLFALFSLQILSVEGLQFVADRAAALGRTRLLASALLGVALVCLLPGAYRSAHFLLTHDTPENVRPLLALIEAGPDLPVVVAPCSTRQIATLPELLNDETIQYFDERYAAGLGGWPQDEPFYVLSAGSGFYCPWAIRGLERDAERVVPRHGPQHTAALYEVYPKRASQPAPASAAAKP